MAKIKAKPKVKPKVRNGGTKKDGYKPALCKKLIDHGLKGLSVVSFCRDNLIGTKSFYRWTFQKKAFAEAFEIYRAACEAFWEEEVQSVASSQKRCLNERILMFYMRSRFNYNDRTLEFSDKDIDKKIAVEEKKLTQTGRLGEILVDLLDKSKDFE